MNNKLFQKLMVGCLIIVLSGIIIIGCDSIKLEGYISEFSIPGQLGESNINFSDREILIDVNKGEVDLSNLTPEEILFPEGYIISPDLDKPQDFSEGPVTYTLKNKETGQSWDWNVVVKPVKMVTISYFTNNLEGWTREIGFADLEIILDETSENYGAIKFYASSTPIILDTYQFSDSFEVSASVKTTRQGDTWFYFYFYDNEEEVLSGGFRVSTSKIDFTYFIAGEHVGGWYTPLASNKIDEYVDYSLIIEDNKIVAIEVNNNYQEIDFPQDVSLTDVKVGFNVDNAPDAYMKNFSVRENN